MLVYKVHKIRIITLLIICFFLLSLFSVFVLHHDVVGDQYSGQSVQWTVGKFWFPFSYKTDYEIPKNVSEDYGDYGPNDIIADDEDTYNGESESELLNEVTVFKIDDFDLNLMEKGDANENKVNKHNILERKLHGQKNENAKTAKAFILPTAKFEDTFSQNSDSYNYSKIFWSQHLEDIMPKGTDDDFVSNYLYKIHHDQVLRVQAPSWDRCGRPKNQYLTLTSGQHVCARYRDPHNYLVQGEVLSFYLSRLLGLHNTPIVTLARVSSDSKQWALPSVKHNIKLAGWKENTTVALIQWIDGLERSRMPSVILDALIKSEPITENNLQQHKLNDEKLIELMQWTDLIVFDYISGHYDRVASMQDAAEKENRQTIFEETVHNLVKSQTDHGLWLIDNESGILDGYTLMYSPNTNSLVDRGDKSLTDNSGSNFIRFHEQMLNSTCLFRKSTVNKVAWLIQQENPLQVLINFVSKYEPYFDAKNSVLSNKELIGHFKERINRVYNRMKMCAVS